MNQNSQSVFLNVFTLLFSAFLWGCSPSLSKKNTEPLGSLLRTQVKAQLGQGLSENPSLSYLASFKTLQEANRHAQEAGKAGASVEYLDRDKKIQKVTLDADQWAKVEDVELPKTTLVSLNTKVTSRKGPFSNPTSKSTLIDSRISQDLVQEALATRNVLGVDSLLKRFPQAEGQNIKVAVFDTGVDFGVEGLNQNLEGFYDFTQFGVVRTMLMDSPVLNKEYSYLGKTVELDNSIAPQKILSIGMLDETALAREYLAPAGIDLNGKGSKKERYLFLTGINQEGLPAVWIDVDQDGKISSREREELTDFNSTHRYIDLRTDVAPSGAKPLAVTIHSPEQVQFHHNEGGHGTSCALIIAGEKYANHYLDGMVPHAKVLSYVLDVTGQDVYTLEQLIRSFEHAKEQKVDAISISWGFTTADLPSARFIADFLDREIASSGILIGIAAGNEGPGIHSAFADDYIPHLGLAVGALISPEQAQNVYGWSGAHEPSVIYYSSVGPTRGGRQVPDLLSPLMTWVRGERATTGPQFRGFGGTSSATPALIGASSVLLSALKLNGETSIDIRLLKLALQNSAQLLPGAEAIRQGSGLPNINLAFDLYQKLAAETRLAKEDLAKRTSFAYQLRAQASIPGIEKAEGFYSRGFVPTARISVSMSPESAAAIDPLTTVEPLQVSHSSSFFETASILPLQIGAAHLALKFDPGLAMSPGVYSDLILLSRPSDGLILLQIPVVIEIPATLDGESFLEEGKAIEAKIKPFDVIRLPITLTEETSIEFEGIVEQKTVERNSNLLFSIYNKAGIQVYSEPTLMTRTIHALSLETPRLPSGDYEVVFSKAYGRPAVLGELHLVGQLHLPRVKVLGSQIENQGVSLALSAREDLILKSATLELQGYEIATQLNRAAEGNPRNLSPAFVGEIPLQKPTQNLALSITQNPHDQALFPILNLSVALQNWDGLAYESADLNGGYENLYRGWVNVLPQSSYREVVQLNRPSSLLRVIAYSNVIQWDQVPNTRLSLKAAIPFSEPMFSEVPLSKALIPSGTPFQVQFFFPEITANLMEGSLYGRLRLVPKNPDVSSFSIPVQLVR